MRAFLFILYYSAKILLWCEACSTKSTEARRVEIVRYICIHRPFQVMVFQQQQKKTLDTEQRPISIPSFVGNDYFCETGVPPGHQFKLGVFYADAVGWSRLWSN